MPINDDHTRYECCAILHTAGIYCVVWNEDATEHHTWVQGGGSDFRSDLSLLVPDVDAARDVLTKLDWVLLPRNFTYDWPYYDRHPASHEHRLAPPLTSHRPYVDMVILLSASERQYDLERHHQLYPSTDPEWIFPPLPALIDSLISVLLDSNHIGDFTNQRDEVWFQRGIESTAREASSCLASFYDDPTGLDPQFIARMRDPKLLNQLKLENRQYHVDRAYGLPVRSREYLERARTVREQLRAGTRGVRDAVSEYDAWVAEMGLPVEESD